MNAAQTTAVISRLSDLPMADRERAVWMWLGYCEAALKHNPRLSAAAMFAALHEHVEKLERVGALRTTP